MKRKSIYTLYAIHPSIHRDGRKGHYVKDSRNCFKCWKEHVGVFSSISKAEDTIRKLVEINKEQNERWDGWDSYVGFVIDEHYLDDPMYGENISSFESCRSYLSDGTLNCISECDDRCEKTFNGTSCPNVHVNKGDFALELCGNVLVPVLVEETSMTKEEWSKRFKPGVFGDYTDDSGLAFTAFNGHVHPFAPNLFPLSCLPFARITKSDIKKMNRMRNDYFEGKSL